MQVILPRPHSPWHLCVQVTPVLGILHDMHARRAAADAGNAKAFACDLPPPERVHLIFAASSHAELSLLDCSLLADARCAAQRRIYG